ncbi:19644_t:CDS:2, partial [Gigaspora rosea]
MRIQLNGLRISNVLQKLTIGMGIVDYKLSLFLSPPCGSVRTARKTHCWQLELNSLTQQEHERVDTYATKFNRVNSDNCLPDAYVVRMFLGGLKEESTVASEKRGKQWKQAKPLNFCEISIEKEGQSREIYNLGNDSGDKKILKRPVNSDWNNRLRNKKMTKTQLILEEEGRSNMEVDNDQHAVKNSSWIDQRSTTYDITESSYEFKLLLRDRILLARNILMADMLG